jgi:hypothetical protein
MALTVVSSSPVPSIRRAKVRRPDNTLAQILFGGVGRAFDTWDRRDIAAQEHENLMAVLAQQFANQQNLEGSRSASELAALKEMFGLQREAAQEDSWMADQRDIANRRGLQEQFEAGLALNYDQMRAQAKEAEAQRAAIAEQARLDRATSAPFQAQQLEQGRLGNAIGQLGVQTNLLGLGADVSRSQEDRAVTTALEPFARREAAGATRAATLPADLERYLGDLIPELESWGTSDVSQTRLSERGARLVNKLSENMSVAKENPLARAADVAAAEEFVNAISPYAQRSKNWPNVESLFGDKDTNQLIDDLAAFKQRLGPQIEASATPIAEAVTEEQMARSRAERDVRTKYITERERGVSALQGAVESLLTPSPKTNETITTKEIFGPPIPGPGSWSNMEPMMMPDSELGPVSSAWPGASAMNVRDIGRMLAQEELRKLGLMA